MKGTGELRDSASGVVQTGYRKEAKIHENVKHLQGYFPYVV